MLVISNIMEITIQPIGMRFYMDMFKEKYYFYFDDTNFYYSITDKNGYGTAGQATIKKAR